MKRKVLNLFSAIGGNRKLWDNVNVTAVEIDPKIAMVYSSQFPNDNLVIGDAMEFLKSHHREFDYVWASPPCQKHSQMVKATRHDTADFFDPTLWQIIVFLQHFFKGKWVVENVRPYYKPLIKPSCAIGRHYFWSNYDIKPIIAPKFKGFINANTTKDAQLMKDWLGIEYEGNIYYNGNHCPVQVLRNAVHPKIGLHVYNESLREGMFFINKNGELI